MKKILFSRWRPESIRTFGYRLLIGGLIADAAVIVMVPSGTLDKVLSALFTVCIALGVWLEEISDKRISEPRQLTFEQQQKVASRMSAFKGLRAVLGAVPPSAKNTDFLAQILDALKLAEVDAFINLNGVEASVSPTGASNRGMALTEGFPNNVVLSFVSGNDRGEAFAKALAEVLNELGIDSVAQGGRDERTMEWRLKEGAARGITRNDKQFEPVVVIVGDKG